MSQASSIARLLENARRAARQLARADLDARQRGLVHIREVLVERAEEILEANRADVAAARALPESLRDRLTLTPRRFDDLLQAIDEVSSLPDPLGGVTRLGRGRSGIEVTRARVPLGVIAIVYEARPNVTVECAALTLKSGNAVVLRGGKEALRSNQALAAAVQAGLGRALLPETAVGLVTTTEKSAVVELLGAVGQVDLVIPRGGEALMALVDEHARVPVIRHGRGVCHVYVDDAADLEMAVEIAYNAKTQRPGVCNATETLLVHESRLEILASLGPRLAAAGVELRADGRARAALDSANLRSTPATDHDWDTEFLGPILAIRVVDDLGAALDHIADHGTHHTAAIVTNDRDHAERFLAEVDASCVLWNASTRLNDGGELGLGAEMGISTSKLHAYGPMGLLALTTEKLVVRGTGQIRT
ncbi:MAG: glutamate-5-semialdehyde dehydrogenase [Deltaproteobacteria bacterium]|nr:glutamate-5-semialdehyde dehydrogenase [Deltaproteobacteria bacterium]